MMPIDNHWNYGQEYRDQMTAPEVEPDYNDICYEIGKYWRDYSWERGEMIDFDTEERMVTYIMTTELNGVKYEGTGTYSCGELILVDGIEIAK